MYFWISKVFSWLQVIMVDGNGILHPRGKQIMLVVLWIICDMIIELVFYGNTSNHILWHFEIVWNLKWLKIFEISCLNYSCFIYLSVINFCKSKFFWLSPVSIGVGSACHLGVLLDVPCLGVAKNLFHIENDIDRNEEHMEQVHEIISHFRWYMYNIFSII